MSQTRRAFRSIPFLAALAAASFAIATTETATEHAAPGNVVLGVMLDGGLFDRFIRAEENLAAAGESDPTLVAAISVHDESRADWLRRIQSRPKALEALRSAGITPTDYMATVGTLVSTYKVVASRKTGKPVPAELAGRIPQSNIAFVESHLAEVDSWKRGSRKQGTKPNTMEDIYSAPAPAPAPPATQPETATESKKP